MTARDDRVEQPAVNGAKGTAHSPALTGKMPTTADLSVVEPSEASRTNVVANHIVVRDSRGQPILGAVVSWTPAIPAWITSTIAETDRPWDAIEAGSTFGETDIEGRCSVDFNGSVPGVIWVSHAEFISVTVHNLGGGQLRIADPIVLADSSRMLVTVKMVDARPAAGADVRQCCSLWDKPVDTRSNEAVAARLFQRRYRTDANGWASLAGLEGYHSLSAQLLDQISNPWTGIQPCEPTLFLRSTYTASGRVTVRPAESPTHPLDRVTITATVDSELEDVGYVLVREDGSWGPLQLPCRPASEYSYHLESEYWMAALVRRPAPQSGDQVQVDFRCERGLKFTVIVVDNSGSPIEGARVMSSSEYGDTTLMSTLFSDSNGQAEFRNVRPGGFWIGARKSGYEPSLTDRLEIFEDYNEPFRVELRPGGNLRGRVAMAGKPVKTFAIRMKNNSKNFKDDRHFLDRTDGTFDLPDLPLGELALVATSLPTARSAQHLVSIEAGQTAEIVLELSPGMMGNGHVLSAGSGEPVAEAIVQPFLVVSGRNLGAYGPAQPCKLDGSFEFPGFGPDRNVIEVNAPGFARLRQLQIRDEQGMLDFGWIVLQRSGRLNVQLNTDLPEVIERFAVGIVPGDLVPEVRLSSSGSASFEYLAPRRYEANVWMGAMRALQAQLEVRPGQSLMWTIEHSRVRDLVVELDAPPGSQIPAGLTCRASYIDPSGMDVSYCAPFDALGRVDFSRIPQDNMVLDVFDAEWRLVMTEWVHSDRSRPLLVKLPIGRPPVRVRIVNVVHKSIYPADVVFKQWRNGVSWSLALPTNEQGELEIPRVPEMSLTALVISPSWRRWVQNLTIPPEADDVLEIVVSNTASIEIRALDGTTPLPGLKLDLVEPLNLDILFESKATSPQGRVRFENLEQQEFWVRTTEIGYWPARLSVHATKVTAQADMQVRRLGGVRLQAFVVGTPLRHKPMGLRSLEFDTDVQEWISAGRVQASSSRLETDADGRLTVDGLPNGSYRWSVKNSSAEVVTGEFTVSPRSNSAVHISLP